MLFFGQNSRYASKLLKNQIHLFKGASHSNRYSYIKKKEIDVIVESHSSNSLWQKLQMCQKVVKCIMSHAWDSFKIDVKAYYQLRQREKNNKSPLTNEQILLKKRMRHQMQRIKTFIIIQILPFSGVILLYYIYFFPTFIPSWFTVDAYYEQYQRQCINNQEESIRYFTRYPIKFHQMTLQHLSLEQLKKLSKLLFGRFSDGLLHYNNIFPLHKKEVLIHPSFSRYLVLRNMKKQFKQDIHIHPELTELSFEQRVAWKYQNIMKGKLKIQFIQPHPEEIKQGEGSQTIINPPKNK